MQDRHLGERAPTSLDAPEHRRQGSMSTIATVALLPAGEMQMERFRVISSHSGFF